MFVSKAETLGWLLAIPTIVRLSFQSLLGTNTPAYYKHSQIMDVKSFITLVPDDNENNHFDAGPPSSRKYHSLAFIEQLDVNHVPPQE